MDLYNDDKCQLVPSRGGPPVDRVREWARALGIPLGRKATMCAAISRVLTNKAVSEEFSQSETDNETEQDLIEIVQRQSGEQSSRGDKLLWEPRADVKQCKEVPSRGGPSAADVREWAKSLGLVVRGQTKRQLCNAIATHLKTLQESDKLFVKQSEATTTTTTSTKPDKVQEEQDQDSIMKRQREDIAEEEEEDEEMFRGGRVAQGVTSEREEHAVNCKTMRKNKCGSFPECQWIVGQGCRDREVGDTMSDERALKRVKKVVEEVTGDPLFATRAKNLSEEDRDAFAALGAVLQEANDDKTPLTPPESAEALDITTAMYVLRWYMSCTPIASVVNIANDARENQNNEEPGIAALVNYFVKQGFVSVSIESGNQGRDVEDVCPLTRLKVVSEIFDTSGDGDTCPARFEGPTRSLDDSSNLTALSDIFKSRCCISDQLSYGSEVEHNRLQTYIARKKRMLDEFARDERPLTRQSSFYRWRREDKNMEPTKAVPIDRVEPRCLQNTCAAPYTFGFGALRCTGDDGETHDCSGKQPPRLNAAEQLISAEVYQDVLQSVIEANDAVNARYRSWRHGYGSLQQNVDFVLAMRSFEEALQTLTHELKIADFMTKAGDSGLRSLTPARVQRYISLFLEFRIAGFRVEHTADSIVNAPGVMTRTQEWMWSKIGKSNWRYLLGVGAVISAYWWGGWLSAAFLAYELFQRFRVFAFVSGLTTYAGASVAAYQTFASQVTDKLSGYFLVKPIVDFGTWVHQTLAAPLFGAEGRVMGVCETVATYLQNLFNAIVVWPTKKLLGTVFTSMQVPSSYSMKETDWFTKAAQLYRALNRTESVSDAREWVLENAGRESFVEDMTRWISNQHCGVLKCSDDYTKLVKEVATIQDAAKLHNVARENYGRLINFPAGKFWLGVAIALLNSRVVDLRFTEDEDVKLLVDKLGVDALQVPDLFDDGRIGIQGTTFQLRPTSPSDPTSGSKAHRRRLQRRRGRGAESTSAQFSKNIQTHQQRLDALGFFGQ